MSQYVNARKRKKEEIKDAFWKLYVKYNYQNNMTVKQIIDTANINRSTFYFYYQNTTAILDDIIATLKEEIIDIYASPLRKDGNFDQFYQQMYEYFKTRKEYLIPLVCESRHPEFALWYRNNQREKFKDDVGLGSYRLDKEKNRIIDIALSGIIEEQIQTFGHGDISIEDSFNLEYGTLQQGLISTLNDKFGITAKTSLVL